jgi:hypothetical protein
MKTQTWRSADYPTWWEFIQYIKGIYHRVGRVLSFFSSRQNWDSPNPSPAGECALPPRFGSGGRGTLPGERRGGESQFQRGDIHCGNLYTHFLMFFLYRTSKLLYRMLHCKKRL